MVQANFRFLPYYQDEFSPWDYLVMGVYGLIVIISLFGNGLVFSVIIRTRWFSCIIKLLLLPVLLFLHFDLTSAPDLNHFHSLDATNSTPAPSQTPAHHHQPVHRQPIPGRPPHDHLQHPLHGGQDHAGRLALRSPHVLHRSLRSGRHVILRLVT